MTMITAEVVVLWREGMHPIVFPYVVVPNLFLQFCSIINASWVRIMIVQFHLCRSAVEISVIVDVCFGDAKLVD